MAVPTKDTDLVNFAQNMDTRITATPSAFGLTSSQATVFHGYFAAYLAAYNADQAARAAGIKDKSLTTAKDSAKRTLLGNARELYAFVQASTSVTDANKNLLGVTVRKTTPTPVPVPLVPPRIAVVSCVGHTVRLRFSDPAAPTRRGLPPGVLGVNIFSFVGEDPPAGTTGWHFDGGTGRNTADIQFASTLAPGAKVWFTAFYFNPRKESGPATAPVGTNIPGGSATPMAA